MTADDIKQYIRYIADWRLGQLGAAEDLRRHRAPDPVADGDPERRRARQLLRSARDRILEGRDEGRLARRGRRVGSVRPASLSPRAAQATRAARTSGCDLAASCAQARAAADRHDVARRALFRTLARPAPSARSAGTRAARQQQLRPAARRLRGPCSAASTYSVGVADAPEECDAERAPRTSRAVHTRASPLRTRFATTATRMLRNRTCPTSSSSLMKFAVACTSIDDGATGIRIDCVRAKRVLQQQATRPGRCVDDAAAVCRAVSAGGRSRSRQRRGARNRHRRSCVRLRRAAVSQFRLEPWGSKSAMVVVMSRDAK